MCNIAQSRVSTLSDYCMFTLCQFTSASPFLFLLPLLLFISFLPIQLRLLLRLFFKFFHSLFPFLSCLISLPLDFFFPFFDSFLRILPSSFLSFIFLFLDLFPLLFSFFHFFPFCILVFFLPSSIISIRHVYHHLFLWTDRLVVPRLAIALRGLC